MKEFNFKKIDAFATSKSDGNLAGYVTLNSIADITPAEMLKIAKEMKGFVNEVGYVCQTAANEFDLKYYSSEREVDFCGHATIAIMYDLLKCNKQLGRCEFLKIRTNRGELTVENRIESENAVFILSPEPYEVHTLPNVKEIADNLGISVSEICENRPISIINAGLTTLIVPIWTLPSILNIAPQLETLKAFCEKNGIDIIEVYSTVVADKSNNYRTRVFAPTFGYIEDAATGSGNSALGYYLIKNNMWSGSTVVIEQNGLFDNFNVVKLQRKTDEKGNVRVLFGGGAITRIEGKYLLQ